MVVTFESPIESMVVMQERTAVPSICTVQAPHSAMPHPNFVPVMPSMSRRTQSSGVSPSTSMLRGLPLILTVKAMCLSLFAFGPARRDGRKGCFVLTRDVDHHIQIKLNDPGQVGGCAAVLSGCSRSAIKPGIYRRTSA